MNKSLLIEILEKTSFYKVNEYPMSISQDLLDVLKVELDDIGIKYTTFTYKQKERLKIYDNEHFIMNYNKNFYHNNSKFGFKVTNDKILTEKYLKLADIPTTNSYILEPNELDEAIRILKANNKKYILKPLSLSSGLGVYLDVNTSNIKACWQECIAIQERKKIKKPRIILQEFVEGIEVRVNVLEGKVTSALVRTPAHVIGEGKKSVEELIDAKNDIRKKNGLFYNKLIKKNKRLIEYLASQDKALDTILEDNELLVLNPVSNMINGGENIIITDLINEKILKLAEDGVSAIPGIQTAGVDLLVKDYDQGEAIILEINKAPAFQLIYYPYIGEPERPLKYIFESLILEDGILNDRLELKDLDEDSLQIISERYKALHKKQKSLEKILEQLEEQN